MLFHSVQFLIFFLTVVLLYFLLPHRFRWGLLLAASYYFYMCWKPEYVLLILISTLVDYVAGLAIANTRSQRRKNVALVLSLSTNLGLLFGFKYANFCSDSVQAFLQHVNIFYEFPGFTLLLPVGISFYTFQTLSYTIDVYRGKRDAERHPGIFAVYVAFFPQLVAGPIERSTHLMPQFYEHHRVDTERIFQGLQIMLWGFFKKLVIADRLAVFVNTVYDAPAEYQGFSLLLATVFFGVQIYCDFSGYSDIAIGAAQVLGFRLMTNFERPYFSTSIRAFWGRWHISLSTWFRDYVYIPLGGNQVSRLRWMRNVLVVFLLSGLWHGANWTFVVWGALHGIGLLVERGIAGVWSKCVRGELNGSARILAGAIKWGSTFIFVNVTWIFFRASTVQKAWYIVTHLFTLTATSAASQYMGQSARQFMIALGVIGFMKIVHLLQYFEGWQLVFQRRPYYRWVIYWVLLLGILLLTPSHREEFIYFQF